MLRRVVGLLALIAIVASVWRLESAVAPLVVVSGRTGATPWTLFTTESARAASAPVVLVAHGFAGSQQFMHPFAVTLAHAGYHAITFDFPGHGRNPSPLAARAGDFAESRRVLLDATRQMILDAQSLPGSDGRMALVGHSMASDIVVRAGTGNAAVRAVVALSAFAPDATAMEPANLLVIDGALEPARLHDEGRRIVGLGAQGQAVEPGVTYGNLAAGTGRRLVLAAGVEHISVLYSREALTETRDWLHGVFGRPSHATPVVDGRGPWIGLLVLAVITLAWTLAPRLPRLATPSTGAGLRWRPILVLSGIAATATPLALHNVRSDLLSVALADYVFMHFALYGAIVGAGLALLRSGVIRGQDGALPGHRTARDSMHIGHRAPAGRFALALLVVVAAVVCGLGVSLDRYLVNLTPVAERVFPILVLLAATLAWFLADEWITRGPDAPRFSYPVTKVFFLASLALAIALDLRRLFFLVIIVPVILLLFTLCGLLSSWIQRHTGHPAVGAVASALVFAWFIALAFPLVGR